MIKITAKKNKEIKEVLLTCRAFAEKTRITLVYFILHSKNGLSPGELVEITGIDASSISHHFTPLLKHNILEAKQKGKERRYFISETLPNSIKNILDNYF